MKKLLISFLIIAGIGVGTFYSLHASNSSSKEVLSSASKQESPQQVQTTQDVTTSFGVPTRMMIPDIDVDISVESVGKDANGGMDVPKDFRNAGWYSLQNKPGNKGNAVIAAHYDRVDGSPAAFWNLPKLKIGQEVTVMDESDQKLTFVITRVATYKHDQFPLEEVFGPSDESNLNLITCQGKWDEKTRLYSDRMVVYTTLKE